MSIAQQNISPEDDFRKVGPDATATFDNSPSNPTEYASSENLSALKTDEDDLEDEDLDEEDEDEDDDEEDDEEEEEEDEEDDEVDVDIDDEDDEDEDDVEEDDHDLAKGPKAPSVYRKV